MYLLLINSNVKSRTRESKKFIVQIDHGLMSSYEHRTLNK